MLLTFLFYMFFTHESIILSEKRGVPKIRNVIVEARICLFILQKKFQPRATDNITG